MWRNGAAVSNVMSWPRTRVFAAFLHHSRRFVATEPWSHLLTVDPDVSACPYWVAYNQGGEAMTGITRSDRRTFLRRTAVGAGALWVSSLQEFALRRAEGSPYPGGSPYGPVFPTLDEASGLPLLELPEGFRYISYGWTGDVMSDGVKTPNLHDGMAVVAELRGRGGFFNLGDDDDHHEPDWWRSSSKHDDDDDDDDDDHHGRPPGRLILVRNHETAAGVPYLDKPKITYLGDGAGGTTNLIFNATRGRWERAWSSLAGTIRNCAGGVTPWGTWITCEETDVANHGWSFEVGPYLGSPVPLKDMGRFSHEADMVDPSTGYVYETEDSNDCGFYRFVPNRYGRLAKGGRLYMLKVVDEWQSDRWCISAWNDVEGRVGANRRPDGSVEVGLFAGWRQGRRTLPASRRRMVGRSKGLLPLDRRRADR
jgi:hypothetical protein